MELKSRPKPNPRTNDYFESKVEIPLIRYGKRQRIETLINEEALLLAKYLRGERKALTPRVARGLKCENLIENTDIARDD